MSTARCPECGGLITADARWCGQCGARFDRREPKSAPVSEAPPAPSSTTPGAVRRSGEQVVWACPVCGEENPIEATSCERCGTLFRTLFEAEARPASRRTTSPGLATGLSLVFPGAGHIAAGFTGQGVARAVTFLWVLGSGIAMLAVGEAPRSFTVLGLVYLLAAVVLYAGTALDASRAAQGQKPALSGRALLYGAGGLIVLTIVVVLISGVRIAR